MRGVCRLPATSLDSTQALDDETSLWCPEQVIWDSLGRTVFTAVASMEGWEDSEPAEASYLVIDRAAR